ncbi:hypothetical protein HPB47_023803, partial [Ixodes persulcatus]
MNQTFPLKGYRPKSDEPRFCWFSNWELRKRSWQPQRVHTSSPKSTEIRTRRANTELDELEGQTPACSSPIDSPFTLGELLSTLYEAKIGGASGAQEQTLHEDLDTVADYLKKVGMAPYLGKTTFNAGLTFASWNSPSMKATKTAERALGILQTTESVCTQPYKFRVKGGSFVCLQTKWKTFKNPWTKEFECLVATNTLIRSQEVAIVDSSNGQMDELLAGGTAQPAARAMDAVLRSLPPGESSAARQSPLAGRLGAGKVGRQVVEHVLGARAQDASEDASSSTLPEAAPLTAASGQPSTTEEASKTRPSTSSAGTEDHNGNSVPADSPEARKLDSAAAGFTTTSPGSVATAES